MSRLYRSYEAELRTDDSAGAGTIEGYASVFGNIDEYGTIMGKGCFDRDLAAFVDRGFLGGLNHNWNAPIGKVTAASCDDRGLKVVGTLIDDPEAQRCRKLVRSKVCRSLSIGFDVLDREYLGSKDSVDAFWTGSGYTPTEQDTARAANGALVFKRVKVYEFSPVMVPGNADADITASRAAPRGGLQPLDEHVIAVRAAVDDLCARIQSVAALRASDGRSIPTERLAALRSLRDRLDTAWAACQSRAKSEDVATLRRELLQLEADILHP